MGKVIHPHKRKKNNMEIITIKISSRQHEFVKEHDINLDRLLQNAIKMEKQRISLELKQDRKKKFNNEFKKIKPRVDEYIGENRLKDPLWSVRYNHAKSLTRSRFIIYGGPTGENLLNRFISNYESMLKEDK